MASTYRKEHFKHRPDLIKPAEAVTVETTMIKLTRVAFVESTGNCRMCGQNFVHGWRLENIALKDNADPDLPESYYTKETGLCNSCAEELRLTEQLDTVADYVERRLE